MGKDRGEKVLLQTHYKRAKGLTKLEGFDKFQAKLANLPKRLENKLGLVVEDAGKEWASLAKREAPKDFGSISKGISYKRNGLTAEVFSSANHSRWVEFGTKKNKRVPPELSAYESSLVYSKTGDYYDFLNSILDWVKRKGFARIKNSYTGRSSTKKADLLMVASAIAYSIMRNGIKPQPFFFKQREIVYRKMMDRAKMVLNIQD